MQTACESYKDLPQNITIDALHDESITTKPFTSDLIVLGDIVNAKQPERVKISYVDNNYTYDVLPLYHDEYAVYDRYLSLKENDYLQLRWNEFLHNPMSKHIKIQLCSSKTIEKEQSRRKTLNGNVYDWNNKLAPIPSDHQDHFIRK